MTSQILVSYVAFLVADTIGALGKAVFANALGVHVAQVKLGFGRIFQRGPLQVGWLHLGSSIILASSYQNPEGLEARRLFDLRPAWTRLAIAISGNIVLMLLACALRGAQGWHSFVNAFVQIATGAVRPESIGAQLIEGFLRAVEAQGFMAAVGIVAAKLAAFNLILTPIFLSGLAYTRMPNDSAQNVIRLSPLIHLSVALTLSLALAWLAAIVFAFIG